MRIQRFLAILLSLLLLWSVPASAAGGESPAPDDLFELGESSEYGDIPFQGELPVTVPRAAMSGSSASTRYDPREEGTLPPVRTQGTWNSCWAVAAMGAAELNGLGYGLLSDPASVDLSERHLIYFFSHQADDPLGNSSGDCNINPSFWLRNGGNPVIASMTMASWHGPASETATDSYYEGMSYSDQLDPSYAYADELHLKDTYVLDISTAAGRNVLKSMLRQYGGAVLCLYYDSGYLFSGSPTAEKNKPTPTPEPTATPESTATPEPTSAPEPTAVPEPTAAPEPTATPEPTSAPEPTAAPEPTSAPEPTDTPEPTVTPEPTSAPEPTAVPVPEGSDAESEEDTVPGLDGAAEEPEETVEPQPAEETELPAETDLPAETEPPAETEEPAAAAEPTAVPTATPVPEDLTVCYYQNKNSNTNHEMLVVGWDDGYPAENFGFSSKGAVPPGDGAWLCRNSHGPTWAGGDGYVWVSYYDASAAAATGGTISGRVTVFDFASPEDYDHNYEYDGGAVLGYVNDAVNGRGVSTLDAGASSRRWYGNVFTAAGNGELRGSELLRAVSTYSYRPGVTYTVSVYRNLSAEGGPTAGILAWEQSGTFTYAGYHTIPVGQTIELAEGERFSVVFRVGMAADRSLLVPACYDSASWYCANDSEEGQSFVSLDGETWLDCKSLKNEANVRVKAFTDDVAPVFPFTDVAAGTWYRAEVESAWLRGLVNGMTSTRYAPEASATRAQVLTILHRLSGGIGSIGTADFDDVRPSDWFYDDVCWAGGSGIAGGSDDDGDGVFSLRPNDPVTRQELAALMYRFASLYGERIPGEESLAAFPDEGAVSSWARDAMTWCVNAGVLKGTEDAKHVVWLDPQGTVTRAQLAAFMLRLSGALA